MPPRLWRLVPALGLAQIVSWGALYYAIAVLGAAMRAELGISEAALFGAYSLSLLLSGVFAPAVGRAIDRWGGRLVMSAGSILAAIALFAIAQAHHVVAVYLAWAIGGVAMALTLYDPAFATLSQHTGARYRTALTALTLLGGLASTVFWPASYLGLEHLGWRATLEVFAAVELLVCLPLHLACIPRLPRTAIEMPLARTTATSGADGTGTLTRGTPAFRTAFLALAAAFALNGFVVSALSVHLIAVLQGKGFALATAVWVASFIGPMQVAGRIAEFAVGRRAPSRLVGLLAFAAAALGIVVLLSLEGAVALALVFAAVHGTSNGILTIVRGAVPAELFGRIGFGATLGKLVAPALIARAIAPLACAGMAVPGASVTAWLGMLAGLSVLAALAFVVAVNRR